MNEEDYNNAKVEVDNADREFDFEDKDAGDTDIGENNAIDQDKYHRQQVNSRPLQVSVLNISKVFKRDMRTYNEIKSELTKSSDEDMPKLEQFFIHQTDRVIKPIIGNKIIEETQVPTYVKNKLPFTPWKIETLKDKMNSQRDIKTVENY